MSATSDDRGAPGPVRIGGGPIAASAAPQDRGGSHQMRFLGTRDAPASTADERAAALLDVRELSVGFRTSAGLVPAVDRVSFSVSPGEIVALVGESGSGKSATALALLGLAGGVGTVLSGSARFDGTELVGAPARRLRKVRGAEISIVFQDPMSSLDPLQRIGAQIAEQVRAHERVGRREAMQRAEQALERAGMPRAAERLRAYPHELSGGMRQRAMIAMALSCNPRLLIADEPTTALDVTVQAKILSELAQLREREGLSVLIVTHDLGVVAGLADRVLVMYAGQIVEQGPVEEVFDDPLHPYTWGLLGSIVRIDGGRAERLPSIAGAPPSPLRLPAGCRFGERCPHAHAACESMPALAQRLQRERSQTGAAPCATTDDADRGDVALAAAFADHLDRCVLGLADKRALRLVDGRIGL